MVVEVERDVERDRADSAEARVWELEELLRRQRPRRISEDGRAASSTQLGGAGQGLATAGQPQLAVPSAGYCRT